MMRIFLTILIGVGLVAAAPVGAQTFLLTGTVLDVFVQNPSIRVDKRLTGGFVSPAIGQEFSYDVVIENDGSIDLDSLTVTDTVPAELDVISVTTGHYANYSAQITVAYTTNLGGPFALGSSPGSTPATFSVPALGAGEYVTEVVWSFNGPVPVGMEPTGPNDSARLHAQVIDPDNDGNPVSIGSWIDNCVAGFYTATTTSGQTSGTETDCFDVEVSGDYTLSYPRKLELSSGPYVPGEIIDFRLDVDNRSEASDPHVDPIVVDLLPTELGFVPGSDSLVDNGTGMTVGSFEVIDDYQGTGRTLLRWRLAGTLDPGENVGILFATELLGGTSAGLITNTMGQTHNDFTRLVRCRGPSSFDDLDLDGDGETADQLCTDDETIVVAAVAQLGAEKSVTDQNDTTPSVYPDHGLTVRGGTLDYRVWLANTGTVPMTNLVIVDVLPFPGDTAVLDTTPRDTGWRPVLTQPIQAPPGAAVFYSTAGNPCRPEVGGPTSGCDAPNWSPTPPTPISDVASLKLEFGSFVLDPSDELVFELHLVAPADAPIAVDPLNPVSGEIAWNSFAFGADRVDGGFLNAEPPEVGVAVEPAGPAVLGDFVWLDTNGNGVQDDGDTGIDGVPVELFAPGPDALPRTSDDVRVSSSITAPDTAGLAGWYEFSGLSPGDYFLCFTPPVGFEVTATNLGGDDTLDSDVDASTLCTPVTSLGPGGVDPSLDLGLIAPATAAIGSSVWFDRNGDGEQNEPVAGGANGVTVRLYLDDGDGTPEPGGDDGTPVDITGTTDDRFGNPGFYSFEDLVPGVPYFVEFVQPPVASGFTVRDSVGDHVDSDADPTTGLTAVVTLATGEFNQSIDAGLTLQTGPLSLGNLVWLDDDNDGLFDSGVEGGVNGVRLSLYRDDNGDGRPQADESLATTTTRTQGGVAGRYLFDELAAGEYIVEVTAENFAAGGALAGTVSSTGNDPAPDPDDDQDNDDNGSRDGVQLLARPITLWPGTEPTTEDGDTTGDDNSNLTVDFGFTSGSVGERYDFGDAPDAASGSGRGEYRTTALDDGPHHLQVAGQPYLGDCVDSDLGVHHNDAASADDFGLAEGGVIGACGPGLDDEDGVSFASNVLTPGAATTFDVRAAPGVADCTLNAWVDWDRNGVFGNAAGEQIASDQVVASGSTAVLNVTVPPAAAPGFTFARFRCSAAGGLGPTGLALSGEVEDYRLRVAGLDLGDAPDSYGTLSGSVGASHRVDAGLPLYLGACVDTEFDGAPSADARGDDEDLGLSRVGACLDDEDGVLFTSPLFPGLPASVRVTSSLGPAVLDGWIDFAADGTWAEAGDQVLSAEPLSAASNDLTVSVPPATLPGTTSFSRFRISSAGGLAPTGAASDGEVEDYPVTILSPAGGPDSFGYTYVHSALPTPAAAFQDISSTGTELTLSATDNGAADYELPFSFDFYGTLYSRAAISTNGYLNLYDSGLPEEGLDSTNDCPLPAAPDLSGAGPWPRLYAYHDDLRVAGGVFVEHFTPCPVPSPSGYLGLPCVVIMWDDVTLARDTKTFDFQAVLFDQSWEIVYQYAWVDPTFGGGATIGVMNGAATDGLMFACNTQGAAATDSAVAFIHPFGVPVTLQSFTVE